MNTHLDPSRTALLLVDAQNDYFHADGAYQRNGRHLAAGRSFIETLIRLCDSCRAAGVASVGCSFTLIADTQNAPLVPDFIKRQGINTLRGDFQVGKWGHNLIEEVKPVTYVVDKTGPSAFFRTALDVILRQRGVDTVLIAGLNSRRSVVATAYDALSRGLHPVIVSDGSTDFEPSAHQQLVDALDGVFEVRKTAEVVTALGVAAVA